MKREIFVRALFSAALAFLIAAGGAGCVVSGFGFADCDMTVLLLCCAAAAVPGSILLETKWGALILSLLLGAAAAFLWIGGSFQGELNALLHRITTFYHGAYGWSVLGEHPENPVLIPLAAMTVLTALSVNFVVSAKHSVLFGVIPSLISLVICVTVTDTVPGDLWLYLLLLGQTLLILTASTRRSAGSEVLGLYLAIPTAALLALLFLPALRQGYEVPGTALRTALEEKLRAVSATSSEFTQVSGDAGTRVDLRSLGARRQFGTKIMTVKAPYHGRLYLRQQDYSTYTGTGWVASENRLEIYPGGTVPLGEAEIRTERVLDSLILPGYPGSPVALENGAIPNPDGLQAYSVTMALEPEDSDWPDGHYRQLPSDTFAWALEASRKIAGNGSDKTEAARKIGDFVRGSAAYDLQTAPMPAGSGDFALWFLNEGETGYCVHFATLTTVLLRGAGIPARYVEGYAADIVPGQTLEITDRDAHAWTEYYDGDTWQILDATPAASEAVPLPAASEETRPATVPTAEPDVTELPLQTLPSVQTPQPEGKTLRWAAKFVGILALAVLAAVLQSLLRQYRKYAAWRAGRPNRRALNRWVQVCRSAKLLEVPVPPELQQLAQKAKFSQYTLTREELAAFERFRKELDEKLRRQPLLRRLWLHIIAAI